VSDDYIDRVGGWAKARETALRCVMCLSSGREAKEEEREKERQKGRGSRIPFIVISAPIQTFIAKVTRSYGYESSPSDHRGVTSAMIARNLPVSLPVFSFESSTRVLVETYRGHGEIFAR